MPGSSRGRKRWKVRESARRDVARTEERGEGDSEGSDCDPGGEARETEPGPAEGRRSVYESAVLEVQESREPRKLTRLHLQACELPRKYWDASFDLVPPEAKYLLVIQRFIEKLDEMIANGAGLLLWGPNRSGKTALAAIVLKEVVRRGFDGHFVRAADLIDATFQRRMVDAETSVVDVVRKSDLLVIDDLGKEIASRSGAIEAVLDNTLRARDAENRSTVITTNLSVTHQNEAFKGSMIALIAESLFTVKVDAKDYTSVKADWLNRELRGD